MRYNRVSLQMIDYERKANFLLKSGSRIHSVVFIEGEDTIVYSTDNWDISYDLELILFNWNKQKRSTDIIYFSLGSSKDRKPLIHTRLQFIYEKDRLRVYKYLKVGRSSNIYIRPRFATENLREAQYLLIP